LTNWLINAFNGEWLKTANATPVDLDVTPVKRVAEVD
jgi:dipeptidyl aminopeptidase B